MIARSSKHRVLLLGAGLLTAALLVYPPIARTLASSFAAHMTQHMLLMDLAALLIVVSAPVRLFGVRRTYLPRAIWVLWRQVTVPVVAALLHASVMWLWHAPPVLAAAIQRPDLHVLMHASFLLSGVVFWASVLRPRAARRAESIFWLFMTVMHVGFLGALLVFARSPLYPVYCLGGAGVLDPLSDQQLAGLIMWVFGGAIYGGAGVLLAAQWFSALERESLARSG